ncbi:MAG: hypothetical protein ACLR3C_14025 [Eggerthella lenta]
MLGGTAGRRRYLASAPSFFQVNTAQAEKLIACVIEGLGGRMGEDGRRARRPADRRPVRWRRQFSVPLAQAGAEVLAVEAAGSSVRDLRRNADMNRVDLEVIGGDAARGFQAGRPRRAGGGSASREPGRRRGGEHRRRRARNAWPTSAATPPPGRAMSRASRTKGIA